ARATASTRRLEPIVRREQATCNEEEFLSPRRPREKRNLSRDVSRGDSKCLYDRGRNLLEGRHHQVGPGAAQALFRMMADEGDADGTHTTRLGRLNADGSVFEDHTALRRDTQAPGAD